MFYSTQNLCSIPQQLQFEKNRIPLSKITNGVIDDSSQVKMFIPENPEKVNPFNSFIHAEIPIGDPNDVQDITEYEHIIYRTMKNDETSYNFDCPGINQTEITAFDRAFLVNWLSRVNYKCQLKTNTLYIAIGIIDRVIATINIPKSSLCLLGAVATLIASKVEDVHPVTIPTLLLLGEGQFRKSDIIESEMQISSLINYDFSFPTALSFLIQFMRLPSQPRNSECMILGRYLCELCMTASEFYEPEIVLPSAIAASCIMMTRILGGVDPWNEELASYTQYSFEDLACYCIIIHKILLNKDRPQSQFITKKYSSSLFLQVATIVVPPTLPEYFNRFM